MSRLRELIDSGRVLVVPGAANALTARVIEDCGFPCVYVTGAGVANTQLAVPDVGLLAFSELAAQVSAIRTAVDVPLIVDADTGFGGPLNVHRTVRELERAGADAIQIEDQTFPKRCGHFEGKNVIAPADMVAKVHAAVDARADDGTLIVARTDARAVNGLEDACERANTYHEAGADIVFVEAPRSEAEIETVAAKVGAPQVVNFVVGGATPLLSEQRLQELGFAIALHANLPLLAGIEGMQHALRLLRDGAPLSDAPLATWEERQRLVRRAEFEQLDSRFSTEEVR
ncbi:isocitrate lyase/PEP mutase family protein [Streptomyces marispadix]|uniref:Isocitrate lyase/PEP mutase family protein n=1 Tax=Streptomyces marispadix TaxID=2922868 RepID=A0ABS9T5N6_9ACTN|nr:isocitrate lyase/PEP mutase family protein [Streptomyces marispadix]MCH6163815.1 isocitrate lyase/PEP mutase family protein [Streptomyces marispadix]